MSDDKRCDCCGNTIDVEKDQNIYQGKQYCSQCLREIIISDSLGSINKRIEKLEQTIKMMQEGIDLWIKKQEKLEHQIQKAINFNNQLDQKIEEQFKLEIQTWVNKRIEELEGQPQTWKSMIHTPFPIPEEKAEPRWKRCKYKDSVKFKCTLYNRSLDLCPPDCLPDDLMPNEAETVDVLIKNNNKEYAFGRAAIVKEKAAGSPFCVNCGFHGPGDFVCTECQRKTIKTYIAEFVSDLLSFNYAYIIGQQNKDKIGIELDRIREKWEAKRK